MLIIVTIVLFFFFFFFSFHCSYLNSGLYEFQTNALPRSYISSPGKTLVTLISSAIALSLNKTSSVGEAGGTVTSC